MNEQQERDFSMDEAPPYYTNEEAAAWAAGASHGWLARGQAEPKQEPMGEVVSLDENQDGDKEAVIALHQEVALGQMLYADAVERAMPVGRVIADPDEGHIFVPRIRGDWSMLDKDLYAAPVTQSTEPFTWYDGPPPYPQDQKWFIAETTFGDRVVLRSFDEGRKRLPDYAFKTADGTYFKECWVRRWMQFDDHDYMPPDASPVAQALPSQPISEPTKDERDAMIRDSWLPARDHRGWAWEKAPRKTNLNDCEANKSSSDLGATSTPPGENQRE